MKFPYFILIPMTMIGAPGVAAAQDFSNQLKARQGQFRIMAFNLGVLGGMARGTADYDADLAVLAAENIATIAALHQDGMWPEGSDNMSIDGTRALPSIWEDTADFNAKWTALGDSADALVTVAGNGQEALGPAVGALGKTCGACHEAYRAPSE